MRTLRELQKKMTDGTAEEKLAAATELSNYLLTYNEEFNMLLNLEATARVAHYDATHNIAGIDHAYRMELEALLTQITARKALLDMRLLAFQYSELAIAVPDPALVAKVKEQTEKVTKLVLKDKAIAAVVAALTDIAELVNGTMETPA